jgi:HK97 family phage major capsid protein
LGHNDYQLKVTTLNISHIERRENELTAQAQAIEARFKEYQAQGEPEWMGKSIDRDMAAWQQAWDQIETARKNYESGQAFMTKMGTNPGGLGSVTTKSTGDGTPVSEHFDQNGRRITTLGRDVNPFHIDERTLDLMAKSVKDGHAFQVKLKQDGVTTKGFNTVDTLLPAELMPGVVERIHEPRIADLLPTITSSTLNFEYISDNTTSNTVSGITPEGAAAPDAVLSFGETTLAAQAIKCTFGASYETLSDRPSLLGYLTAEVFKQFSDEENSLLLNGTSGIVGLTQTSGITTVAVPGTLPTGANLFDYVISIIDAMRVSKSLAVADKAFVHPATYHALIAQSKDSLGRWLSTPDPTTDIIEQVFGVKVYLSTAVTAGQMVFLDTDRFGFVVLREGLRLLSPGYNASDFSEFLQRWAVIERLNLAVVRPTAVGLLTGLPTSFAV